MKELSKAVLVLASVFSITSIVIAGNASRNLTESQILMLLEKQAPEGLFPETTKVRFVGTVSNKYTSFNLVFTTLIWGEAQHETARLVLFSSDWKYLGNYGGVYVPPASIHDGAVYWSYSSELGNKIDLNGQYPPKRVVLDGEMYQFDTSR